MTTINLMELKNTRKRSDQREWVDSFEVAEEDILTAFDPDTHGPSDGAALIYPAKFNFEDGHKLRLKIQSAVNGATQGNDRRYKVLSYGDSGVIVIRTA